MHCKLSEIFHGHIKASAGGASQQRAGVVVQPVLHGAGVRVGQEVKVPTLGNPAA